MLIQPTNDVPIPSDVRSEDFETNEEQVHVIANTATVLAQLGMPLEFSAKDEATARDLLTRAPSKTPVKPHYVPKRGVAVKLAALLTEYDHQIIKDVAQMRSYVTHRLMEISDCGDPKHELKALELLGKITDVGLFTEKSEVTVHHKSSSDLESAIKDRIKKLLGQDVIDVTPTDLGANLDEELGGTGALTYTVGEDVAPPSALDIDEMLG
jgi:hypothetical protein